MTPPHTAGATSGRAVRDYLACLSLANLYFVNVWVEVGNRGFDFFRGTRPAAAAVWATATLVVVLSLVFWIAVQLWRRLPERVARPAAVVGIALSLIVPANVIHKSVLDQTVDRLIALVGRTTVYGLVAISAGVLFAWLAARTASASRAYAAALSLMLPLAPILAMNAAWVQWQRPPADVYAGTVPSQSARKTPTRLVVMVFDEWDQRLPIDERPDRVELPALDRMLGQSFHASRAVGGGYLGVEKSISSMLTGQRLQSVDPRSVGVELEGDRRTVIDAAAEWAEAPTLFSELTYRGWSSGIVGWFIPYCRLLGQHLRACSWQAGGSVYGRRELVFDLSYPESLRTIAVRQLERVPMSRRLGLDPSEWERRQLLAEEVTRIRSRFSSAVDTADLVYVHWPVPHPFGLVNPSSPATGRAPNYFDNLLVVDRLLADVEDTLTRTGRWDQVTLLLTSDHSLRTWYWEGSGAWTDEEQRATGGRQSPYVPFIVKFAGRHAPLVYDQPFTIALLYDVVLAMADQAVTNPTQLATWLDAHRGKHPTDVNARRSTRVAGSSPTGRR